MPFKEFRIHIAHAGRLQREREKAANTDESAPEYREDGYDPPSKDVLDAIPRREG